MSRIRHPTTPRSEAASCLVLYVFPNLSRECFTKTAQNTTLSQNADLPVASPVGLNGGEKEDSLQQFVTACDKQGMWTHVLHTRQHGKAAGLTGHFLRLLALFKLLGRISRGMVL